MWRQVDAIQLARLSDPSGKPRFPQMARQSAVAEVAEPPNVLNPAIDVASLLAITTRITYCLLKCPNVLGLRLRPADIHTRLTLPLVGRKVPWEEQATTTDSAAALASSRQARDSRRSEIELKLTGDPGSLLTVFRRLGGVDADSSEVVSTYYDTIGGRLWREGFAFRLRARRGGYELTLKKDRGFVRREWTSRIGEPVADVALLPQNAPHGELNPLVLPGLVPVFVSEVRRRQTRVEASGSVIDVALDTGRMRASEEHVPVAELEFELVGGPVQGMLRCIRTLLPHHRLSIHTCSKATRGMVLAGNFSPADVVPVKIHVRPDDTVDAALAEIVGGVATRILENIPSATDGSDPEGVHQMRVGLRRFRSAIGLFRAHVGSRAISLNGEASRALRRLGSARDLDVLVSETIPRVLKAKDDARSVEVVASIARQRIVDARSEVRRLVADPRFNCFLIDLLSVAHGGGLVKHGRDTPLSHVATTLLRKRHRRLLKAGANFAGLTDRRRHKVRIAAKNLRYACDFLQDFYPGASTKAYIGQLAHLQKHLGRLNDVVVAERMASDLSADESKTATDAKEVRVLCGKHLRAIEPRLVRKWSRVAQAKPFWQ